MGEGETKELSTFVDYSTKAQSKDVLIEEGKWYDLMDMSGNAYAAQVMKIRMFEGKPMLYLKKAIKVNWLGLLKVSQTVVMPIENFKILLAEHNAISSLTIHATNGSKK